MIIKIMKVIVGTFALFVLNITGASLLYVLLEDLGFSGDWGPFFTLILSVIILSPLVEWIEK